jgi:hypothetical protein
MNVVATAPLPTISIPNLPFAGFTLVCFIAFVFMSKSGAKLSILFHTNNNNVKFYTPSKLIVTNEKT